MSPTISRRPKQILVDWTRFGTVAPMGVYHRRKKHGAGLGASISICYMSAGVVDVSLLLVSDVFAPLGSESGVVVVVV